MCIRQPYSWLPNLCKHTSPNYCRSLLQRRESTCAGTYRRSSSRLICLTSQNSWRWQSLVTYILISMNPVSEAPLRLLSRIQDNIDDLQCVDLVECSASGRRFIDKHTLMTSCTPEGCNASATALHELDLHLSIRDTENVVKIERHSLQGERLHLLHEHCGRGDLLEIMQQEVRLQTAGVSPQSSSMMTLTDAGRRRVFTSILRGVHALHTAGIAHMDLSPENIFVTNAGVVKVGDLGHARRFNRNQPSIQVLQVAKEAYAAPELLCHTEVEDARCADAWSLGVILWTLCTKRALVHRAPSSTDGDKLFSQMAERGTVVALQETGLLSHVSASCVDLIAGLLDMNTKTRFSVATALHHPWIMQEIATTKQQSRRKSIGSMIKKKGEEFIMKHQRPTEKKTRVRTASAEIALESTRVTLTSRSLEA
ncbi:serine/threonine protein kinase [Phytophthora nicotianae]|uniref:Serine/threonine protein kinase n=1 Tax=Phytophthora nicotianae TaxID=4792 RepID=W2KH78_PHYNI|nr:serine/threonine protein kinase [Phytophthora nicotianae]